jgi:hypothetical protein
MKILIACLLMLGFSAPLAGGPQTPEERDRADLRFLEAKIDRLIGTASCEQEGECRSVAFGAKPCGGPWKYKIYSTRGTDASTLKREIDAYKTQNDALNKKYGLRSDCSFVSPPVVACRDGVCVAGATGAKSLAE